jgi:hypothetical protein
MQADFGEQFRKFGQPLRQCGVSADAPRTWVPRQRVSAKFIPPQVDQAQWYSKFSLLEEIRANIERISEFLIIKHTQDIIQYLLSEPAKSSSLIDVIYKVIILKKEYFGDEAQLVLTLNVDPEIENEYLKFYIRQSDYPDDFMDRIARLRSNYYEDLRKNDIWILVSTDFKRV